MTECYNDFSDATHMRKYAPKRKISNEVEDLRKGRDSYEKMDENGSHNDGCSNGIDSLRRL